MVIGERLKQLRESKKFSQGDIEVKTGLLRCYTSRVENGHTVPAIETLEKYARALDVELYQLFTEKVVKGETQSISVLHGKKADRATELIRRHMQKLSANDQKLLIRFASLMANRKAA